MFDKQKIIAMTAALEEFVRIQPNIFILPEVWSGNLLPLLKRFNANVVGIMTNAPVNPEQNIIQTPSGNYPLINFQDIMSKLNAQTGIIISAAKQNPNPIFPMTFKFKNFSIEVPAFALTEEETIAIYDRLTTLGILTCYKNDGILGNMMDVSIRFARGMSTLIDSPYQDVKVQVWDKRDFWGGYAFKMPIYDVDDAAIVMQGPIEYKDNYTITTAKLYREWYPNAPLIISTWKNESTNEFREECKKIGVVLLENDLPSEKGVNNVNYQLESSLKGVEYATKNTSVKYALKCRTDWRLNRSDFLIYFKNLLRAFPPNGDKLNARIIVLETDIWIPFSIPDYLYFGEITDMNKLFSIPKMTIEEANKFNPNQGKRLSYKIHWKLMKLKLLQNFNTVSPRKLRNHNVAMSRVSPPEMFIMKSFYNINIAPIEPEKFLQIYWKFLRDYLIVVDDNDILFEWLKYQWLAYVIPSQYSTIRIAIGIDHARWLDIYLNYKDK